MTLTLGDGTVLSLDHYPTNLAESIQTASAEGTTTKLALSLKDIGLQLVNAGKISQSEYNDFERLANQGHQLASFQRALEDGGLSVEAESAYSCSLGSPTLNCQEFLTATSPAVREVFFKNANPKPAFLGKEVNQFLN